MDIKKILLTLIVVSTSFAAKYYVDYAGGSDANNGTAYTTPWKHAPGDSEATVGSNPRTTTLAAGDTVFLKGGTRYRSKITPSLASGDGTSNAWIVWCGNRWPGLIGTKAIYDGSTIVANWTQCASAAQCKGNPHYQSIWRATLPSSINTISSNLCRNDTALAIAQLPNAGNAFKYTSIGSSWYSLSVSGNVTATSIKDVRLARFATNWNDLRIAIHCHSSNVELPTATGFDAETNTLSFTELDDAPDIATAEYSILNSLDSTVMDTVGDYCVIDDTVWAYMPVNYDSTGNVMTVARRTGLDFHAIDYVSIEGFDFFSTNDEPILSSSGGSRAYTGFRVVDCNFRTVRMDRVSFTPYMVHLVGYDSVLIDGCDMRDIGNVHGFGAFTGRGVRITDNTFNNIGATVCYCSAINGLQYCRNTLTNSDGSHSNGLSAYTDTNVLYQSNYIFNVVRPITVEETNNYLIFQNVAYNVPYIDAYVFAQWSTDNAKNAFYLLNNIIVGAVSSKLSLFWNPTISSGATYRLINNIIGGDVGDTISDSAVFIRKYNIYTQYGWPQSPSYGWYLRTGEKKINGGTSIFVDTASNLRPKSDAISIDSGIDPRPYIRAMNYTFTELDTTHDILGYTRPNGSWDIGPYEYGGVAPAGRKCTITIVR